MQIQLKQNEIVTALKQYITQQGINLKDKEVKIVFTAGRKEGGLSADINIEDIDIPGFNGNHTTVEAKVDESPQEPEEPTQQASSITEGDAPTPVLEAKAEEDDNVPVAKTTSLFS